MKHRYNLFQGHYTDKDTQKLITCTDEGVVCPVCGFLENNDEEVLVEARLGSDGDKGLYKCKSCGTTLEITMMAALYRYKAEAKDA